MARLFGGKTVELLAPAGTFDIFRDIIKTPCDAVYTGGQAFNMRMIRAGYNLSKEELAQAVEMAREQGKKLYITVNSLVSDAELPLAAEYLSFLGDIRPDALIIQDVSLLTLAKRHCPCVPLHASVMMNVHNLSGIEFLARHGVSRVVLSREMPLYAVRDIASRTDVELEYFTHGDMCVANGSLCWYSSYLFGQSSNRGRCLKPCRWPFTFADNAQAVWAPGREYPPFPLAVKDLNLHEHLPDLLAAGVVSFKIEGRMRQSEFIVPLIHEYADALDRFLADPLGGAGAKPERMEPFLKRDYSTGYAYGAPGRSNINTRGEGTGKFYSTGKMFSQPSAEKEIPPTDTAATRPTRPAAPEEARARTHLSVRVNSIAHARIALAYRCERIYLSAEPLLADYAGCDGLTTADGTSMKARPAAQQPVGLPGSAAPTSSPMPSLEELHAFHEECAAAGCRLFIALPRMLTDVQTELFREWFSRKPSMDGVLVSHGGALDWLEPMTASSVAKNDDARASSMPILLAGDTSLNVYNGEAARFWAAEGLSLMTASCELPFDGLAGFPAECPEGLVPEVTLHGLIPMMYLDHDVSEQGAFRTLLETPQGKLTVLRDCWNRYHLFPAKELSLLPRLGELMDAGYRDFRLELQAYPDDAARNVLEACRAALDAAAPETAIELQGDGGRSASIQIEEMNNAGAVALAKLTPLGGGFTYGAHGF